MKFKRLLLKLSGEALEGKQSFGICPEVLNYISNEIKELNNIGVGIAVVIGGGNIFRGLAGSSKGMDRNMADHMGMLATMINSVALCENLLRIGCPSEVYSAVQMTEIAERFSAKKVKESLAAGKVAILGAGTGHPFFTTDTTAALRALEIGADIMVKATKVDGIYDKDPVKYKDAVKFDEITYSEVLKRKLQVMDLTAVSLSMDNNLPILVLDMNKKGNIKRAVLGEKIGTIVIPDK
ncbi:MAG TPA: UMP kinase [bacterium]|nr:UMP kinase [bacterium]